MEADKSGDLQGQQAGGPRKADGTVSVQVQRPENHEGPWYKFQFESKSEGKQRKGILSSSAFYSMQAFNQLDGAHHIGEGNLIQKHPHRNVQNNI